MISDNVARVADRLNAEFASTGTSFRVQKRRMKEKNGYTVTYTGTVKPKQVARIVKKIDDAPLRIVRTVIEVVEL